MGAPWYGVVRHRGLPQAAVPAHSAQRRRSVVLQSGAGNQYGTLCEHSAPVRLYDAIILHNGAVEENSVVTKAREAADQRSIQR